MKEKSKLRLLIGYYKPYKLLFLADLFFAMIGAMVTLVIPLLVRYIMHNIESMGIAEEGTHEQLLQAGGDYAKLYKAGF